MRIAICDDEPAYRRLLRERILQDSIFHDYETEMTEYEDGAALLAAVGEGALADVFFLDIQMEQGSDDGIRVGRELRRRGQEGLIVYVTGFIDYAQAGYEVKAFRYLLKSQISDRLPKVMADIRRELSGDLYCFQSGGRSVCLDKRKILYLESNLRVLKLVTEGKLMTEEKLVTEKKLAAEDKLMTEERPTTAGSEYRFYDSLEHAQEKLGEGFLRCHRSFLVNVEKICTYSGSELVLQGDIVIPVSRTYRKAVKQRLMMEMR